MTDTRRVILNSLKDRLERSANSRKSIEAMQAEVDDRLADPPTHPLPARGRCMGEERTSLFIRMAKEAGAEVERIASASLLPERLSLLLEGWGLNQGLLAATDPMLIALPWAAAGITLRHGRASSMDQVSIAVAYAGVAETGSLLLVATPQSPMSIHLLSDLHVVLLPVSRLFGTMEEAFVHLRRETPGLPSASMFVTGPSRTADIEQQMQLGAHGPRELRVYIDENE